MIVVVATGTITELDCEEVSRLQPKIESINVRESVKTEEPNKSVITEDPVESSTVEEPKEPGIAEEPIDPATTEGPSETANSIDIITLLNSILLKDLIEPPDLTKENEAFIIEVEQDEKAYLEAIRKQQEIAAKQYEKERKEREAWFKKIQRENDLLSSDEEEFAKAEEEENKLTAQELISAGLYEKEYSEKNEYSYEYPDSEWDEENNKQKYFKKVMSILIM